MTFLEQSPRLEVDMLAVAVAALVEKLGVHFERGDPREFFKLVGKINLGLTLPLVSDRALPQVIEIKNLCALWNVLIDDEIDRAGTRKNLDASMLVLLAEMGHQVPAVLTPAGTTVRKLLGLLPEDSMHDKYTLYFDMWEVMQGCNYEHSINRLSQMANSIEYDRYSTMSASIKTHLDIDLLFSSTVLPTGAYAQLRRVYDHLTAAIKYSSDVGSLRRELLDENNLNLIRIEGAEAGIAGLRQSVTEQTYLQHITALTPAIEHGRSLVLHHLNDARTLLDNLAEVDAEIVFETAEAMADAYLAGEDLFFPSAKIADIEGSSDQSFPNPS